MTSPPGPTDPPRRRVRLPFIAIGMVTVVIGVGIVVWSVVLPHRRPGLEPGERYGVDVSNHQKAIDWDRVAADDIAFAYVKATEGGDFVDQHFQDNWDGAARAGLDRGAYHFFTLCRPGADQAENFLRVVPRDDGALPAAVDLEFGGNCAGRPDRAALLRELTAFIEPVEDALGREVVLYVMDDFEEAYRIRSAVRRPLWARALTRPDDDWSIWQFTGTGAVEGIDGDVDLNVARNLGS